MLIEDKAIEIGNLFFRVLARLCSSFSLGKFRPDGDLVRKKCGNRYLLPNKSRTKTGDLAQLVAARKVSIITEKNIG